MSIISAIQIETALEEIFNPSCLDWIPNDNANNYRQSFRPLELFRAKWGFPYVACLIAQDILIEEKDARKILIEGFLDHRLFKGDTRTVTLGDYIVLPVELKHIQQSGIVSRNPFKSIHWRPIASDTQDDSPDEWVLKA